MRFLYLGPFRFPDGDAAASRVLNNARILNDLGHTVTVLSFGGRYRDIDQLTNEYFYEKIKYIISNDIDTHSFKERLLRYIYPGANAWKYIKKEEAQFDAIITYNTTCQFNWNLLIWAKRKNKKLILDLTEWPEANETPGGKYSPIYWMSEINMKCVQKKFKNLILISKYLAKYYNTSNTLLLPPLINIKDNKWNVYDPIYNKDIQEHQGIRIIFAGTPAKKDLLGNLIQALIITLNHTKKIQLIIIGVPKEQATQYVEHEYIEKYKKNIIFIGRIPQYQVPSFYHISDFSAIIRVPNRKNMAGFPTKMAESMAAGCPVLMNATSDLMDYAIDGQNAIIIKDYTINSIVNGLNRILLLKQEQLRIMKKVSRQIGDHKFDYRHYIDITQQFINQLK